VRNARRVERFVGTHQHAGQRQLAGERGIVALDQQHLPGLLNALRGPHRKEHHVHRDHRVELQHPSR